jgi:hypothetical protein
MGDLIELIGDGSHGTLIVLVKRLVGNPKRKV